MCASQVPRWIIALLRAVLPIHSVWAEEREELPSSVLNEASYHAPAAPSTTMPTQSQVLVVGRLGGAVLPLAGRLVPRRKAQIRYALLF